MTRIVSTRKPSTLSPFRRCRTPLHRIVGALAVVIMADASAATESAATSDGIGTSARKEERRTWTSVDGRMIEGVFVDAHESGVSVRRENGRVVEIPTYRLSGKDRDFVATKRAEQEMAKPPKVAHLTYILPDGSENWDPERKKQIVASMDAAVKLYNQHGVFNKRVWANNSPGTPTADANYEGWINFGGSRNTRVALHEISHTLGVGTHPNWQKNIRDGKWTGPHALKQLREFDGPDATLSADRMHFWPYGLNFDRESSPENNVRHVKMVAALRKDMGIE
jgi:hypothetical protein